MEPPNNPNWFDTNAVWRCAKAFLLAIVTATILELHSAESLAEEPPSDRFAKWEPTIVKFEQRDAEHPPVVGGIVFVGGSIIRMWDLPKWFGEPAPLNRGFGGSQIIDAVYFVDQLVLKHKPRIVVFYSGDNDIAAGVSGTETADRFVQFCKLVHAALPKAKILVFSIKPSPKRWQYKDEQQAANSLIRQLCDADKRIVYIDMWPSMIDSDGQPRRDLLVKDMLHLNEEGYKLWTEKLKPLLSK